MLPKELLNTIDSQYPCRAIQLTQLSALVGDESFPSPSAFVLYGLEATGKTLILKTLLKGSGTSYSWLSCHECITARHLTERIGATVSRVLEVPDTAQQKCENVSALAVYLQQTLKGSARKHFLVLDRIDQQREPAPTLIAALKRMSEFIPTLTVVFIVSAPNPRQFNSAEMPHIHFPPYSKEESIEILSKNPLPIEKVVREDEEEEDSVDEQTAASNAKEELYVWLKFCATVWDSLAKGAARDVVRFRTSVEANWPVFVQPIARGEYGTRNYASLYLYHKEMFRRETSIIDTVVPPTMTERVVTKSHDLPYYSKFLLCAAYLASYNPARLDITFFIKASDPKKRKRGGRLKKQAGTRKIQRRLMGAQAFPVERLLAIFLVITPQGVPSSVDIQAQIATLTALRLLTKTSPLDPLDGSAKWKVNVGWEYIRGTARNVKFDIEDYMAE